MFMFQMCTIGVCYGTHGDNPPSPSNVISLIKTNIQPYLATSPQPSLWPACRTKSQGLLATQCRTCIPSWPRDLLLRRNVVHASHRAVLEGPLFLRTCVPTSTSTTPRRYRFSMRCSLLPGSWLRTGRSRTRTCLTHCSTSSLEKLKADGTLMVMVASESGWPSNGGFA